MATESERDQWRVMATTIALTETVDEFKIASWAPTDYPSRVVRLVNADTGDVTYRRIEDRHYTELMIPIVVHIGRNISPMFGGEDKQLPSAGHQPYRSDIVTAHALDPNDPHCKWYFWSNGK